jgi:hypothetical protein
VVLLAAVVAVAAGAPPRRPARAAEADRIGGQPTDE